MCTKTKTNARPCLASISKTSAIKILTTTIAKSKFFDLTDITNLEKQLPNQIRKLYNCITN